VFKECPLSVPFINSCVYSLTTSGSVTIGSTSVPIVNPIAFQGGETREVVGEEEFRAFVPAANGETLTRSPQPVPGGLAGLLNCPEIKLAAARLACEVAFENGATGVNVNTEIVGPVQYSILKLASHQVGLVMPVRVKLENPFLGSECYIGSASEPITLNMTTGTTSPPPPNQPISGADSGISFKDEGGIVEAEHVSAVDNSFSVPTVNGCGGALLAAAIDPVIDLKLGLPSPAGKNTAILNGSVEQALAYYVQLSEGSASPATAASRAASASAVSGATSALATTTRSAHARHSGLRAGTYAAVSRRLR
jgi:hypothetical protein